MTNAALCSVEAAAAEIVALINASARTPSAADIVSVIARAVPSSPPMAPVPASTLAAFEEYRRLARKWIHAEEKGWRTVPRNNSAVEAAEATHDELSACLERIWATAPRGWADVVLLALIYANTTDEIGDGAWLYLDPKRDGDGTNPCNNARARAFLLDAIFQTAGVRLPLLPRHPNSPHIPSISGSIWPSCSFRARRQRRRRSRWRCAAFDQYWTPRKDARVRGGMRKGAVSR